MSLLDKASLVITPNAVKESKLYSVIPSDGSGDLDVVRATTATRVNSDGLIESVDANVPRLDYTNGSCPSILVEPQRTNYVAYSELPSTWSYTEFGSGSAGTITTGKTDMFGGTNAVQIDFPSNAENVSIRFGSATSSLTSGSASLSLYIKLVESGSKDLQLRAGFDGIINVNSTEFTRVDLSGTKTNTELFNLKLRPSQGTSSGGFSIIICHPQEENGSYATSYIPTVASAVTRNADVISKTGISDLIGQTEGTLYADVNIDNFINGSIITIDSGTSANFIQIFKNSTGDIRVRIRSGSGALPFIIISPLISLGRHKIALNYTNGDYALFIDGIKVGVSTNSTNYPLLPITSFILSATNYGEFNDSYNSVAVWKTRLTDSELATLTTI